MTRMPGSTSFSGREEQYNGIPPLEAEGVKGVASGLPHPIIFIPLPKRLQALLPPGLAHQLRTGPADAPPSLFSSQSEVSLGLLLLMLGQGPASELGRTVTDSGSQINVASSFGNTSYGGWDIFR